MTVLFIIAVIVTAILIHELGHFWVAKYYGMPVHAFSIGIGPILWSHRHNGTHYSFKLVPLGGYVLADTSDISSRVQFQYSIMGPLANFGLALACVYFAELCKDTSLWQASGPAYMAFGEITRRVTLAILGIFTGATSMSEVSSVVGLYDVMHQVEILMEWRRIWLFAAIININLAVVNLLPLPVLDGGKIAMSGVELLIGRPLGDKTKAVLFWASAIVIVAFTLWLLGRDILALFF